MIHKLPYIFHISHYFVNVCGYMTVFKCFRGKMVHKPVHLQHLFHHFSFKRFENMPIHTNIYGCFCSLIALFDK